MAVTCVCMLHVYNESTGDAMFVIWHSSPVSRFSQTEGITSIERDHQHEACISVTEGSG